MTVKDGPQEPGLLSSSYHNAAIEADAPTERTALLSSARDNNRPYRGGPIDPAEFDNLLSRSELVTTGLGVEPESQETAMLRGPRRYSSPRPQRRDRSHASSLRKSLISNQEAIEDDDDDDDEGSGAVEPKSPYLGGVSVARFWLIFSGILTMYFVACFDSTIMVSSHPIITSYFHSSNSASWLSTAFLMTATSFQPLFGRLSDTMGRKPPYIFNIGVFLAATVWCARAQSMLSFILARAVCGFGAGGMMTVGTIITSDLVPIEIRGAYQSYINIIYGVGSALGAALGGAIADNFGWRWEFYLQVPILMTCLGIACVTIPRDLGLAEGVKKKSVLEAMKVFDLKGSFLLISTVIFLILGLNLGGNVYPWSHPIVVSSLVIFCISCPLFIYVESHVELPIMPLDLLMKNPRAGLILANSIGAIAVNTIVFNTPLYFQAVLLESATDSGLRLIVPSIAASITGTAVGFLITWSKRLKPFLLAGAISLLAGSLALAAMGRGLPNWAYVVLLIPWSVGQGFMFPTTVMAVLTVSPQSEQAVVTSTLVLWRSLGTVLGVATGSLVMQNALYRYLEQIVTGPFKDHVIQEVRKSVTAIPGLEEHYREQVIDSYAAALKATFLWAAALATIALFITVPIKLPRIGKRK